MTTVAVLTTADRDGWWWGCPVNSVTPVSSHPPMVAVNIPRGVGGAFAIHVLRAGQEALADHFASAPTDFDAVQTTYGIAIECGLGEVPLLCDVASRLECRPVNTVAAGSNVLVLAEVLGEDYRRLARPA